MKAILLLFISLISMVAQSYMIRGVIDNKNLADLEYCQLKVVVNQGQYTGFVDNLGNFNIYVKEKGAYKPSLLASQAHPQHVLLHL